MAKIAIFIDHNIMIRHFIHSKIFQSIDQEHDVTYIFPNYPKRVSEDLTKLGLSKYRTVAIDANRAYLWRRLYQHMILRAVRRGFTENKKHVYKLWQHILGKQTFRKTWLNSLPIFYYFYKRSALKKIGRNLPLEALLEDIKPDLILHPTVLEGLFVSDLVQYGKQYKIPTVYLMNSWDNPSSKAMTVGHPDWLVVWGEQTKIDANVHLQMPKEKILIFGAAQFDVYRETPIFSKQEFCKKIQISADSQIILFGGSRTGFQEVDHLKALEKAIEDGRLKNCHVVYRPHPWRGRLGPGEKDFFSYQWKHTTMDPLMVDLYKKVISGTDVMFLSDVRYTHAILNSIDLVISPLSTILVEAGVHDKPCLAFVSKDEMASNPDTSTALPLVRYQQLFKRMNAGPIDTIEELIKRTQEVLTSAKNRRPGEIKDKSEYFVHMGKLSYAEQLHNLVHELTDNRSKPLIKPSTSSRVQEL